MKKFNLSKSLRTYTSEKICYIGSNQSNSVKKFGKKIDENEEFLGIIFKSIFSMEVFTTNDSNIEERKLEKYADVEVSTEKSWSQKSSVVKEDICSLDSQGSVETSSVPNKVNYLPKDEEHVVSSQNNSDIEDKILFCEPANSKKSELISKCDIPNPTTSFIEKELFVPAVEPKIETSSISKSNSEIEKLEPFEEYIYRENTKELNQILDEDSAYGSGESLPGSSPEPRDIENGRIGSRIILDKQSPKLIKYDAEAELNKKSYNFKKSYQKYLDEDSECICVSSDCDTNKQVEFQEFLNGVNNAKPRIVRQAKKICALCNKDIVDGYFLSNRFGLLLNCIHSFCYHCIYSSCYRNKSSFSLFNVSCPVCGEFSPGIVSSSRWIQSKIKKTNLFRDLQAAYIEWKILKSNFSVVSLKRLDR